VSDSAKAILLIIFIVFIVALFGSWLTLTALNALFGLNIPITIETILASTWLTMTLKGIFTPNNFGSNK
jgi:hypothetical protein